MTGIIVERENKWCKKEMSVRVEIKYQTDKNRRGSSSVFKDVERDLLVTRPWVLCCLPPGVCEPLVSLFQFFCELACDVLRMQGVDDVSQLAVALVSARASHSSLPESVPVQKLKGEGQFIAVVSLALVVILSAI